jgi:hypothetical protein
MGRAARIRCESEFSLGLMAERWRDALHPIVAARLGTTPPDVPTPARRASAFRRAARLRRRSSQL